MVDRSSFDHKMVDMIVRMMVVDIRALLRTCRHTMDRMDIRMIGISVCMVGRLAVVGTVGRYICRK